MLMNKENGSSHEKIDFKIPLPCSSFLLNNSCDNDDFAKWLSSGQLTAKYSIRCGPLASDDINTITNKLCSKFEIASKFN